MFQFQLADFNLGQVENVVEDRQQMAGGDIDLAQLLLLLGIVQAALQQVSQSDDGVHRGADFVAHVGQKCAFGPTGLFRRLLGRRQGYLGPAAHDDSPQVVADQLQAMLIRFVVVGGFIAHAQQRPDFAVFQHRYAQVADQVGVTGRIALAVG